MASSLIRSSRFRWRGMGRLRGRFKGAFFFCLTPNSFFSGLTAMIPYSPFINQTTQILYTHSFTCTEPTSTASGGCGKPCSLTTCTTYREGPPIPPFVNIILDYPLDMGTLADTIPLAMLRRWKRITQTSFLSHS